MLPQKVLTPAYAVQGFAYAGPCYDTTLAWDVTGGFRAAQLDPHPKPGQQDCGFHTDRALVSNSSRKLEARRLEVQLLHAMVDVFGVHVVAERLKSAKRAPREETHSISLYVAMAEYMEGM